MALKQKFSAMGPLLKEIYGLGEELVSVLRSHSEKCI